MIISVGSWNFLWQHIFTIDLYQMEAMLEERDVWKICSHAKSVFNFQFDSDK